VGLPTQQLLGCQTEGNRPESKRCWLGKDRHSFAEGENQMTELVMNMGVGTATWNAEVSETIGVASHVFASASRFSDAFNLGIKKVGLATQLWKYSNFLTSTVDKIHAAAESAQTSGSRTTSTEDQVEGALRSLEYLHEVSRRLYQTCEDHRLTNSSMMAASLRTINLKTEQLMDVIDWLRCYVNRSSLGLEGIFADARKKLENGDVYDLAELR